MCLFSNVNSSESCYNNRYTPLPITQADGPAFIAPFWNDIDLSCFENGLDIVQFDEKPMDDDILRRIQEQTGSDFIPDYYVRVFYDNVKEYPCKEGAQLVRAGNELASE